MRTVRPASEAEMVALFLSTEYPASRTHQLVEQVLQQEGLPPRIVERPNLGDERENALRRHILGAFRGYGQSAAYFAGLPHDVRYLNYFAGFPLDVRWQWAELSEQELEQVKYIEDEYWIALSGGSRLPRDAAQNVLAGREAFGVSNQRFLQMAEAIRAGAQFPPLILVGKNREGPLVVLEGHARLTAMLLAPECLPVACAVMAGFSEQMERWGCF